MPPRHRSTLALSFMLATLCVLASRASADDLSRRFDDHLHRLEVRLDPAAHTVSGKIVSLYTNRSAAPLHELVFHLYPNAFEHDETVFMRESGGSLRGVAGEARGHIALHALRVDGVDRLDAAEGELIPRDRTQLRLPLEAPLLPGARVELEIEFTTKLPALFARSGHVGSFHIVAQFFPKLAKLTPEGQWRSFPYHGLGEFFADFANYELTVNVPRGFRVASAGVRELLAEEDEHERNRFFFRADAVHDVAFVAWDAFETRTSRCHGVRVHSYFPPGGEAIVARSEALACLAFDEFGRLLFPYPYKDLTLVIPPRGAEGGAGMEYPGLLLSSAGSFYPRGIRLGGPDDTTAHELAHQWFQGVVASDEVAHPMIDEGLATFFGFELLARAHGRERSGSERPALDIFALSRVLHPAKVLPPARAVHDFPNERELYASVYGHVPLFLESVARTYGRERLMRALGHFARRGRFSHPEPKDLSRSFAKVCSPWFMRTFFEPALFQGAGARFSLEVERTAEGQLTFRAVRGGKLPFPTTIAVTSRSGDVTLIPFPGDAASVEFTRDETDLERVEIDPDHALLLDGSRADQRYVAKRLRLPSRLYAVLRALFAGIFG